MKKIKIIRSTVAGGQAVNEGQIIDVSDGDARVLIGMGKAVAVVDASAIETADAPVGVIETADAAKPPKRKK